MSLDKSNFDDLLARVSSLEQRERRFADEILTLTKENNDLKREVEANKRNYKELKRKFDSIGNFEKSGRSAVDTHGAENKLCLQKLQNQSMMHQKIEELKRMTKVLNRALIQSHEKLLDDTKGVCLERRMDKDFGKHIADLLKWKDDRDNHDEKITEKIRSLNKQTGILDAMKDQLEMLALWKETKEASDEKRFKRLDDNIKTINSNTKGQDKLEKISRSIFCVALETNQPLQSLDVTKLTRCTSALLSNPGPFESQSGTLKPEEDGIYNLGWNIHQKGDGKIRYILAIEGMKGRMYLGCTKDAGDKCCGTIVVPLKKQQRIWLEARRVGGLDASIKSCNFMGWLLKTASFHSNVTELQEQLLNPILSDCQHL